MIDKEKQIEEMARDICRVKQSCNDVCHPINNCRALKYAERFYNAGYRKQIEGEWVRRVEYNSIEDCDDEYYQCSVCGLCMPCESNFCMDCGAKMKGDAK